MRRARAAPPRRGARPLLPVAAAALAVLLAGCAATRPPEPPATAAPPRPPAAESPAQTQTIPGSGRSDDPEGKRARELALLRLDPANPAPDHGKALAALRAYLAASPQAAEDVEIGRLLTLLEALELHARGVQESKSREKELAGQVRTLRQTVAEAETRAEQARRRELELLGQIRTLQQRIEQLQKLDLEMEQRRRSVR